jgi:hypothetical protein
MGQARSLMPKLLPMQNFNNGKSKVASVGLSS